MLAVLFISGQTLPWYDEVIMPATSIPVLLNRGAVILESTQPAGKRRYVVTLRSIYLLWNRRKLIVRTLLLLSAIPIVSAGQTPPSEKDQIAQHEKLAQQYLRDHRPDLAIPELDAAVQIDPDNVEIQGNLGVLLFFFGKQAEAIPHLRTAVEKQPDLTKIQGILGIAELHTNDLADGRKDLETAFPHIDDEKFKVQVGLELVGVYTRSTDLDQAAAILVQLKKIAPESPEVLYAFYRTYADLSGEAMLDLSLAAPDSAQMHQLLAHEETKEGNTNGAISQYRKAIEINTHLPGVHFELAELLNTAQDPAIKKQAEQEYRAALKDNPRDEKSVCELAEIAMTKGDESGAFKLYSTAIELQPDDANAKLGLAKVLLEMNKPDQALPLLEASVQLEPTNATAHYRLATLYKKLGRTEDAKREVELYQKYKEMKEKLRVVYKDLLIQPDAVRSDANPEK
jgi:Tfp pilus assembly protein PilF